MAKHGQNPSPGSKSSTGTLDTFPPVDDADSEDVAWALRTAVTLWKRHEHLDAIVWLRRAAQAAGDDLADDRALYLARAAADLAELAERRPTSAVQSVAPAAPAITSRPPASATLAAFEEETPTRPASGRVAKVVAALESPLTQHRAPSFPNAERLRDPELDPWADSTAPVSLPPPAPRTLSERPEPFESDEVVTSAPPLAALHSDSRVPPAASSRITLPDMEVDLEATAEFSDLPDDARHAFARAAITRVLVRGDELSGFAVALVVSGALDVSSTIAEASVTRLTAGSVLRSRGTVDAPIPMHFVCASDRAVVATWLDAAVDDAFRDCPWVEDELRKSADKVQALVGAALGPFGDALGVHLRNEVMKRMHARAYLAGEVIAEEGAIAPGVLVVGLGDIELVREGHLARVLRSGDLAFASEALGDRVCEVTLRAGASGALALFADRALVKAMVARWPQLIEAFAQA